MAKKKMGQLCTLTQISSTQERMPQTERPRSRVEEECQTQAHSAQNPFEGLAHHPSLGSRPPPHLRDASIPIPGPVLVVAQLS